MITMKYMVKNLLKKLRGDINIVNSFRVVNDAKRINFFNFFLYLYYFLFYVNIIFRYGVILWKLNMLIKIVLMN